jgi:hypothetical protein
MRAGGGGIKIDPESAQKLMNNYTISINIKSNRSLTIIENWKKKEIKRIFNVGRTKQL